LTDNMDSHDSDIYVELGWITLVFGSNPSVPYVPTRKETLDVILDSIELGREDIFYDLGCGDGRVVVEVAKRFPVKKAVCIEARRDLVEEAKKKAVEAGVSDRVVIIHGDFFKVPIRDATVVYMYLLTSVNEALKPKLERELREGARIITLDFQIPGWKPVEILGEKAGWQRTLYVYVIGKSNRR